MRKYILALMAFILLIAGAGQLNAGVSDAAVLFLRIAAGARAAGMGEAFVAIADDATATHWNPAGLGMYPLSSEYHVFKLDDNPQITEQALKVLKGELDSTYQEKFGDFVFHADSIYLENGTEQVSYQEQDLDKDVSALYYVISNLNTTDRDLLKLGVRAVAKENSGASYDEINRQRMRLINYFPKKERRDEINRYFERLLANWQELKVKGESIKFLGSKIDFALADSAISEKEYGEIMMVVDKGAELSRPEKIKIPYSVLFSLWKDFATPLRRNLTDIALVENGLPESNYQKYDIWGLTTSGLVHFDGKEWSDGSVIHPANNTTIDDIISDQLGINDAALLELKKRELAEGNSKMTRDALSRLLDSLNSRLPGKGMANLQEALELLKTGWLNLTLDQDRLMSFAKEVENVLAQDSLTTESLDRLAFLAARIERRRMQDKITIPFKMVLGTEPTCLVGMGKYLWVGTDEGLFRFDAKSKKWKKFTSESGLPDNRIKSLSSCDDNTLWLTTPVAVANFTHEKWTIYGQPEGIVDSTLYLIYAASKSRVWAVSRENLYSFDGAKWKDYYDYETAVNDSLPKIVRDFVGYGDPDAIANAQYLIKTINQLRTDIPDPGQKLMLPYRALMTHHVNALCLDSRKHLWLGTDNGIKVLNNGKMVHFGYRPYAVAQDMTVDEIAADFLKNDNAAKINQLVNLIKDFNKINTNKIPAGRTIYVYSNSLGSKISTVESDGSSVYVGTQYGLVEYSGDRFSYFYQQGLEKQKAVEVKSKDGEIWFATPGKVVIFASAKSEITGMHANWLPQLADDIYYEYLSYIHHLGEEWGTVGFNVTFLSYGQLVRVDEWNNIMGTFNAFDMAIGLTYGKRLSNSLSAGLTAKWIYSRLSDQGSGRELGQGTASSLGVDIGLLCRVTKRLNFGTAITNLGPDISYIDAAQSDPLPRNLAIGLAYRLIDNPFNRLTLVGEINKMLTSLNGSFSEELKEAIENVGFEYWYGSFIAFRAGYIYDQVGEVKTPTLGVGLQYRGFRFDFAYIPSSENVPLANTVRFSLTGKL